MSIKAKFKIPALLSDGYWAQVRREISRMIEAGEIDPAKGFTMYLADDKAVRSNNQNRFYWSVCVKTFADAVGMESDELHDIWKRMFAGYRMMDFPGGKRRRVANSTATMSVKAMSEYLEKCIAFSAENGVVIPDPQAIPAATYVALVADGTLKH